jgi:hypothetical protein
MLACYTRQDDPANRVKPIPVAILRHLMAQAILSGAAPCLAMADMICLAFYFLLRPGEYTGTGAGAHPFTFSSVALFVGPTRLNLATAPADLLPTATFVTLEFTRQKNGVSGEVIGLGRSGDPHFCPVAAATRRILHLRTAQAHPTQPLASYVADSARHPGRLTLISPSDLTHMLRLSAQILGPQHGFLPSDISARSLRASGAMAMLCANIDPTRIRLLGRWRSDEVFRYLHVQAEPLMRHFSSQMLQGGNFTLLPNHEVPLL